LWPKESQQEGLWPVGSQAAAMVGFWPGGGRGRESSPPQHMYDDTTHVYIYPLIAQ
jgi:hypothetical protein